MNVGPLILGIGVEAEKEMKRILSRIGKCVQKLSVDRPLGEEGPQNLKEYLVDCGRRISTKTVFILGSHDDLEDCPGGTLIIPDWKEKSIMMALTAAQHCHSRDGHIGKLVFVTDSYRKSMEESFERVWILANDYGVRAIGLLPLEKKIVVQWRTPKF